MDKQNILSQVLQGINSTQNLSSQIQLSQKDLDTNQKQDQKNSPNMIKEQEQDKKIFNIPNNQSTINAKELSKKDTQKILSKGIFQSDESKLAKNIINQLSQKGLDSNQNQDQKGSDKVAKEQEMKIFGVSNKQSTINAKDLSKEDIKEIQNQEISQSDEIKLVKNTLNNQNQDQKSSDNVVKEQEMKIFGISNNKISLDVEDLSKDDIKEIQNQEISQSDENKLSDNKKGNLIFQKNMEKLNHHLNQENLSNMKKEGEDQNTSILLHSDITLKKKIKILLQRNLANNKSSQKFNIQIFNTQEEQSVIINNENNEKMVYHQYISTNLNQQENKSEDFYSYAHTIHKGKQNILDLLKQQRDRISYDPQVQQPQHIANTIKQDQTNFNVCLMSAEQDYAKIEKIETDIENLSKNTYQSSNQFDQTQIDTSVQNEAQNKINLSQSEKQLTKRYDSCIQKLIKQIKELNTSQNEQDQQKLDQINQNQSASFKVQKAKIFQKLNENKFEFIKILNSYDKQTLIQGQQTIQGLADQTKKDAISLIYHNPTYLELFCLNQIFKTLQIMFDYINITQENISIFIIQISDFEDIQDNIKLLTKFENIYQLKDYYEINSTYYPSNCKKYEQDNFCGDYKCFQNIKPRIIAFLQFKNQLYCEYHDHGQSGLILSFSQEKLITFYTDFVYKLIFSFLEIEEANQQNTSNEIVQISKIYEQPSQLEIFQKSDQLQLINQYQFKEYLAQIKLDSNVLQNILNNQQKRQWDISTFIEINANEISEMFIKEQNDIISLLKEKNYYLCKSFNSNFNEEDVFIGYQEETEGVYSDFVFIIKYSPTSSEIQKYLLIQKFNEPIIHLIIKSQIHILILSKDAYLQIQNNFGYIEQSKIDWSKEYFEMINKDKIINQENCNKCKECKNNQKCQYFIFSQFQKQKDAIFEKLKQKNYYICEYLSKGGEGLIFQGYSQTIKEKQEAVFKILLECDEDELQNEIKIMKLFDQNINIIKFIDHVKIYDQTHILVLEKCQFSLQIELDQINQKKSFPLEKLLQMIFNLLDGLIQFRIYNILHLDIKPQNILVTNSGQYVFTDFGMSSLKKNGQKIDVKGWTQKFASPEQLLKDENIDYQSDIYSLGKTFLEILKSFEDIQQQNYKDLISKFKVITNDKMVQNQSNKRLNCLEISNEFYHEILKQQICYQFLISYIPQMNQILQQYPHDKNKEISYFLKVSLFYYQNILNYYQSDIIKASVDPLYLHNYQIKISELQINIGYCYQKLCDYKKAIEYIQESHQKYIYDQCILCDQLLARSLLGKYDQIKSFILTRTKINIADSLNNVGSFYLDLDDKQKALEYYLESHKIRKNIHIKEHPQMIESLQQIGQCYFSLTDYKQALEYLLESLQMTKQIFKEDHPSIAKSLKYVGYCYLYLDDKKKALEYLQESLQMTTQIFKQNSHQTAHALSDVGNYYQELGDYKKALEYHFLTLQMQKQNFKADCPCFADQLIIISDCYQYLGYNNIALDYSLAGLQMLKQILHENDPKISEVLNHVAFCYHHLGNNKMALEYSLKSLQMRKQLFKDNHPSIAYSMDYVSIFYKYLQNNKMAFEYLLKSLQMRKQILKENHIDIAKSLEKIHFLYLDLRDYKMALEYCFESLQIKKQIFIIYDFEIAKSMVMLSSYYIQLGKQKMALEISLEYLQMCQQNLQEVHPSIAISLAQVGFCYYSLGDYKKALRYQLQYLQMKKSISKENSFGIVASLMLIGFCYMFLDDYKKSLKYFLEFIQMKKKIFKEDHPDIFFSMICANLCFDLKEFRKGFRILIGTLAIRKQIYKQDHHESQK